MKWLLVVFVALFGYLQYRLWFAEGSFAEVRKLHAEIATQQAENNRLQERNRLLSAEVSELKNSGEAIEERARTDLGMIKEGETFYMVVPEDTRSDNK